MSSDPAKSELPAASRPAPHENLAPATRRVPTDDTEVELWVGNYSGKEMVINWVLGSVITVVAIVVVAIFFMQVWQAWAISMGAVALMWAWLGLLLLYRKWSVAYRLTNQRFVHRHGLLAIRTDRIETIDIDDVAFTQGFFERMMGVGTIRITSTDRTHPELILRGIDKVQEVASLMDGARRKERVRRGLHIEAT
jgi:membrane protein YdbS with pleckstrin-like domain